MAELYFWPVQSWMNGNSCHIQGVVFFPVSWHFWPWQVIFSRDCWIRSEMVNFQGQRHNGQRAVAAGWGRWITKSRSMATLQQIHLLFTIKSQNGTVREKIWNGWVSVRKPSDNSGSLTERRAISTAGLTRKVSFWRESTWGCPIRSTRCTRCLGRNSSSRGGSGRIRVLGTLGGLSCTKTQTQADGSS